MSFILFYLPLRMVFKGIKNTFYTESKPPHVKREHALHIRGILICVSTHLGKIYWTNHKHKFIICFYTFVFRFYYTHWELGKGWANKGPHPYVNYTYIEGLDPHWQLSICQVFFVAVLSSPAHLTNLSKKVSHCL